MAHLLKKVLSLILPAGCFLLLITNIYAQDFRSDYQVDYFLSETENRLNTKVKFTVSITNMRTDVYVKQFSIVFPKSFTLRDVKAFDDYGPLPPEITSNESMTKITLDFSNPSVGKNSKGNFYLEFNQDNLFTVNGNVWEVIIPTVDNKQNGNYRISVQLPQNSNKKISISKPKPDNISGNTIIWNNPNTKTVYAVFGDKQYYKTELTYNLKNNKLVPVYMVIALPPDTLFQKIYFDSIDPKPSKVFSDEDGNYLARFYLNPKEVKSILYSGTVAVQAKLREEVVNNIRQKLNRQKKYLLNSNKYWKVPDKNSPPVNSSNVKDLYDFVVKTLKYNYKKIDSINTRLGGENVLKDPKNAVCMEFTDLFISLARNNDIYSREIEGYGFSQDPKLRPLSLSSDILHSWPEYYDRQSQLWLAVDPTWENTSGIDYFSSFDLNHIAFVIHGKEPDYPLPAGTYKTEDSRDVLITASNRIPDEIESLSLEHDDIPKKINDSRSYMVKLRLTNTGNVYLWSNKISVTTNNLEIEPKEIEAFSLAPLEEKEIILSYKAREKNKQNQAVIKINFPLNKSFQAEFRIFPFYLEVAIMISLVLSLFAGVVFIIILYRKTKRI